MDDKLIYKVLDCRGRITIPKIIRDEVDLGVGDVVELYNVDGNIQISKAEVIHIDATSQISLKNTAIAAFKEMDEKSLIEISKKAVCLLEKRKKGK